MTTSVWRVLTPEQIAVADVVAGKRRTNARAQGWTERNGAHAYNGDKLDIMGARGEMAVFVELRPAVWHYFKRRVTDLPDFNSDIDAKTRPRVWHDLPLTDRGHADWKYILVCAEQHPAYEIVGWAWGHEIMDAALIRQMGGFPAYCFPRSRLRDITTLLPIFGPRV